MTGTAFRAVPLARATAGVKPRIALAPVSISYRRRPHRPPFAGLAADVEWMAFNHTARNALHLQLLDSPETARAATAVQPGHPGPGRRATDRRALHHPARRRDGGSGHPAAPTSTCSTTANATGC